MPEAVPNQENTVEEGPKPLAYEQVLSTIRAANQHRTVERNEAGAKSGTSEGAIEVADSFLKETAAKIGIVLNQVIWDAERGSRTLPLDQVSIDLVTWLTFWPGMDKITALPSFQALKAGLESRGYYVAISGSDVQYSAINSGTHPLTFYIYWGNGGVSDKPTPGYEDIPSASDVRSRIEAANSARHAEARSVIAHTAQPDGKPFNMEDAENRARMLEAGKLFLRNVIAKFSSNINDAIADSKRELIGVWNSGVNRYDLYDIEDELQPMIISFGTDPRPILGELASSEEFAVLSSMLSKAGYPKARLESSSSNLYRDNYRLSVELFN